MNTFEFGFCSEFIKSIDKMTDKDAPQDATVTIKGSMQDANDAKQDILNLTSANLKRGRDQNDNSRNYESQSSSDFKENLEIYQDKVGMVIGRGGATIKEIQSKYNVRVNINKDTDYNGKCGVSVSGNRADVANAIGNIRELVGESNPVETQRNHHTPMPEPEPMDFEPIDWQAAARESVSQFFLKKIFHN